jgi:two-component system response regulator AlgR
MPVAEIRCFIAGQKYVTAHGPGDELLLPDTLKDLQEEFGDNFLRVHRNALVSLAHIARLQRDPEGGWCVALDGVDLCPQVSRRHLPEVKRRIRAGGGGSA